MLIEASFTKVFDSNSFLLPGETVVTLEEACQRIDDFLWENGDIVSSDLQFKIIEDNAD